jgi:hypothetical protein
MPSSAPATAPGATLQAPPWARRLAPAALPWLSAITFLLAWPQFPSAFHDHMARLMELEFLALHAGAFIGLLALWNPGAPIPRLLRWTGIAGLACLYLYAGHSILGWSGTASLAGIIASTWGGLLWSRHARRARRAIELGVRWFLALLAFGILSTLTGMPQSVNEWHLQPQAPLYGALYFTVLGLLEASGLYRLIRTW